MPDIELKLKWRRTWDDHDNDFSAFDERYKGGEVGRFYLHDSGPTKGQWFWYLTAYGRDLKRPGLDRGYVDSAREAGACVDPFRVHCVAPASDCSTFRIFVAIGIRKP